MKRFFRIAQERLAKGLRKAKANTLREANLYLDKVYMPMWNGSFTVAPIRATDVHRPLLPCHDQATVARMVVSRRVTSEYKLLYRRVVYQIPSEQTLPGLLGSNVQVEERQDGSLWVRWKERYLELETYDAPESAPGFRKTIPKPFVRRPRPGHKNRWMDRFFDRPAPPLWSALR
jgi:hypothetical protein